MEKQNIIKVKPIRASNYPSKVHLFGKELDREDMWEIALDKVLYITREQFDKDFDDCMEMKYRRNAQ